MSKSIFVVRIGNYRPDLCRFTIPTIRHWATLNGWEYREITERRFPEMPITAEKLQVRELGRSSEWNLMCDADLMIRPDLMDPSAANTPDTVFSSYALSKGHFDENFEDDIYFQRDGRRVALSGGFYGASRLCLDLWDHPTTVEDWRYALSKVKKKHIIDEYLVARNIARFGLKVNGVADDVDRYIVHFGTEDESPAEQKSGVASAERLWNDWLHLWPELQKSS